MSLITQHSDVNKVVKSKPVVRYVAKPYYHQYSDGQKKPIYWTLERSSTWSFSYVGMTEEAAVSCANAVRSEYLLTYMAWEADVDTSNVDDPIVNIDPFVELRCSANIQANHEDGSAWRVDVSVEESDVVISTKELKTLDEIESFFQQATDRKIVTGRFKVLDAHWSEAFGGQIVAEYFADISDFAPTSVVVKVKSGESWTDATVTGRGTGTVTFSANANKTFKLVYESIESNEFTTKDSPGPTIVLESVSPNINDRNPPPPPGRAYSYNCIFEATCSIKNGVISESLYYVSASTGMSPITVKEIQPLGGVRYKLTASALQNISRGIVFNDGNFYVSYMDDKSSAVSNGINFSTLRNQFATIGLVECEGYFTPPYGQKTWRLKVHAKSGIDLTQSNVCSCCSMKWDETETVYQTAWQVDTDTRFDYVAEIDVVEANSDFNQGVYLKYVVGSVTKYSEACVMPTDGGPI